MDVNKIFYFHTVATYLNFTKAAQACHIAQTAMSRSIASLEEELGFTLFYRNRHKVELTPAGQYFLQETDKILQQLNIAQSTAIEIANNYQDTITIGFGGYDTKLTKEYVSAFHAKNPQISIVLREYPYEYLAQNMMAQNCDIIFSPGIRVERLSSIRKILLLSSSYTVALSSRNPLFQCESIRPEQLRGKTFICPSDRDRNWVQAQVFKNICQAMGIEPGRILYTNSAAAVLTMVELNLGFSLLSSAFAPSGGRELGNIPIEGDWPFRKEHWVACQEPAAKEGVKKFMDFAEELASRRE